MNIKISLILFVILISGCKSWNIQITRPGYDPGYHKQYPRLPHAFALVKNPHPVRYGEKSERFEVRDGDCGDDDCRANTRYRSEISIEKRKIKARFGEDIWYGWSFYNYNISEYDRTKNMGITVGQWKMGGGNRPIKIHQPPMHDKYLDMDWKACDPKVCSNHLTSKKNDDVFLSLDDLKSRIKTNDYNNYLNVCRLFSMKDVMGKWTDIVYNTNFSTENDGYINIWINGIKRCEYRGPIFTVKDFSMYPGPVHRRGIYVSYTEDWDYNYPEKDKPIFIAYYDEFRVGRNREEVDIRIIEKKGFPEVD